MSRGQTIFALSLLVLVGASQALSAPATSRAGSKSGTCGSGRRSTSCPTNSSITPAAPMAARPLPLNGWKDFRRCRPEPSGLREVYFRYDDELEYWAKANDLTAQMEQYSGTKTYGFPIVVSALIDGDGVVSGIRIVSDPRDPTQNRDEAYLLRNFLTSRFGRDGWQCETPRLRTASRRSAASSSSSAAANRSTSAPPPSSRRAICASPAKANTIRYRAARPWGCSSTVRFELRSRECELTKKLGMGSQKLKAGARGIGPRLSKACGLGARVWRLPAPTTLL